MTLVHVTGKKLKHSSLNSDSKFIMLYFMIPYCQLKDLITRIIQSMSRRIELLRKNQFFSSPKTSQQSVFPSFYSILLGLCQGCYCKESYFRSVHIFVLQCTVSGRNVNTRRMSKPDMGSIFHIKKSMKYSGHRKLLCELSKLSKFNAFNLLGY